MPGTVFQIPTGRHTATPGATAGADVVAVVAVVAVVTAAVVAAAVVIVVVVVVAVVTGVDLVDGLVSDSSVVSFESESVAATGTVVVAATFSASVTAGTASVFLGLMTTSEHP
eukprot:GHVT01088546.1.p2 GENE.GHVT01088546.1~~GHVT01088546.1.p2  ORF type:complete len:113 (-),score=15.45 GHVT01088546.1:557-895(-)